MTRLLILSLILLSCKKDSSTNENIQETFMSAIIDGQNWRVSNFGDSYFGPNFDYSKNRFLINVGAKDQNPNSICNLISINFDFVPKPGRHYFNNIGSIQLDSGIIATYTHNIANVPFTKYSTSGFVDIEYFTKEIIKGKFNFTATGDITDTTITTITSGSFSAINSGGNNTGWTGP